MTNDTDFHRLPNGMLLHREDPDYDYKLMRFLGSENPIQKANILLERAERLSKFNQNTVGDSSFEKDIIQLRDEAKSIYFRLLRHKESMELHRFLVPLVTANEAKAMITKYKKYPDIKLLYADRLNSLGKSVRKQNRKGLSWIAVLILLAVLIGTIILGFLFYFRINDEHNIKNTQTNVTRNYVNNISYINQIPTLKFEGTIPTHSDTPSSIAEQIDNAGIPAGMSYLLQGSSAPIGYATNQGANHYLIGLLNSVSSTRGPVTQAPVASPNHMPSVTPFQLNLARTAYVYYLNTHNDVPPASINQVKSLVPGQLPMNQITFNPSTSPAQALTIAGRNVPFEMPEISVNISNRTLSYVYNNSAMLQFSVGVGSPADPTPTGTFTITNRIPNDLSPVYGDYIFPLNNSSFAIHGTNVPSHIGKNMSLGCVEVSNSVDDELYRLIPVGIPVIIRDNQNLGTISPDQFR